jgi:hypothetical protein
LLAALESRPAAALESRPAAALESRPAGALAALEPEARVAALKSRPDSSR